jgi:hypothetical protein
MRICMHRVGMLESYPMLTSVCTIALSGYHAVMLNTSKSAIENTNLHHEFARVLLTLLLHVILTHAHERARAHAQVSNVKTGVGIGRKCFRVGVSMYVCVCVCVCVWICSGSAPHSFAYASSHACLRMDETPRVSFKRFLYISTSIACKA